MTYLDAATEVGRWLETSRQRGSDGWAWPVEPLGELGVDTSFGWGSAGPTMFFVEAYRTTRDDRWLAAAREGARWMAANLDDAIEAQTGCGLFSGVGGWAVVLDELVRSANDDEARALAARVIDAVVAKAETVDSGVHWHDLTEILWGTAGIGCLLLDVGPAYLGDRAVDLATRAGDWLLSQSEVAPGGVRWALGNGISERKDLLAVRFPNFAHGTAGIAFFLAKLGGATGEARFLESARQGAGWILTTVRADGDTCAAYHHEPGGTELFTLGWCHGPPGLGWLFRQLEIAGAAGDWRMWLRRAARADSTSGIPARLEPGFWDNVARCCGSAGVAEFFLDLHSLEGSDDDLAFARTMVDDLLARATVDGTGMRWSNVEFRAPEPRLPAQTTYLQGAAGIGSTLLRMHRHLRGDPWVVAWPHAPTWKP